METVGWLALFLCRRRRHSSIYLPIFIFTEEEQFAEDVGNGPGPSKLLLLSGQSVEDTESVSCTRKKTLKGTLYKYGAKVKNQ